MKNRDTTQALRIRIQVLGMTIGVTGCVAILFYRSFYGVLWAPIIYILLRKRIEEKEKMHQNQMLLEQFMHAIHILSTALQAGLSMENAWREAEKELRILYGTENFLYLQVKEINHLVSLNNSIEKCVLEFAQKTELEEIIQFAEVFDYGKRNGGNWNKIIGSIAYRLNEKFEAKKQIELMVAEKRLEQQVMNVIPLAMLAFLQVSSWDYMSVMYHNPLGVICMTMILILYVISIFLAENIMQIKV